MIRAPSLRGMVGDDVRFAHRDSLVQMWLIFLHLRRGPLGYGRCYIDPIFYAQKASVKLVLHFYAGLLVVILRAILSPKFLRTGVPVPCVAPRHHQKPKTYVRLGLLAPLLLPSHRLFLQYHSRKKTPQPAACLPLKVINLTTTSLPTTPPKSRRSFCWMMTNLTKMQKMCWMHASPPEHAKATKEI